MVENAPDQFSQQIIGRMSKRDLKRAVYIGNSVYFEAGKQYRELLEKYNALLKSDPPELEDK